MNPKLESQWMNLIRKTQGKIKNRPFQILIHSDSQNIHIEYPLKSADQRFHIASVSKLITATYVLKLVEEGALCLSDPITHFIDPKNLIGLFEGDPNDITLWHCLTHRTGAADFFEGKDEKGVPFLKRVIQNPDEDWSALDLLDYTRFHMKPISKIDATFAYGDTGYLLLVLAIEKLKGEAFPTLIEREFLRPLGLNSTQVWIYTDATDKHLEPLPIFVEDVDARSFKSLSCGQADGGFVSTPNDILRFQTALYAGKIINLDHLRLMQTWQGTFRAGIHYGLGMMQIRFEEFFFLMRGFPRLIGHIGILSTYAFYDPQNDIHYILNMGGTKNMTQGFVLLSRLVSLHKAQK